MNSILDIDYEWWMTPEQKAAARAHEKAAKAASAKFDRRIKKAIEEAAPFMREWGDGNGGEMMRRIEEQMYASGAIRSRSRGDVYQKAKISRTLAKSVFERDAYRCVMCSSHVDLCCDHIISERDGGPTTLENLQTLCRSCNSTKGKKSFSVLKRNAA